MKPSGPRRKSKTRKYQDQAQIKVLLLDFLARNRSVNNEVKLPIITIAESINSNVVTVSKALNALEQEGYLVIDRKRKSGNTYKLINIPSQKADDSSSPLLSITAAYRLAQMKENITDILIEVEFNAGTNNTVYKTLQQIQTLLKKVV